MSLHPWCHQGPRKPGSCVTSWEIDGETVETVSDFIFLGSKITADGDCSHEIISALMGRASEKDWPKRPSDCQLQEAQKKTLIGP